ncbi:hypothetical protein MU582_20985 [Nocardioidaceae bacterium SCSIO 66511]|nr:hypothetical protein MU582_20985 [Nocardioidaceae bacterium SCSIO 66511]
MSTDASVSIPPRSSDRRGRVRTAWRSAHAAVAGVPRWARIAAYTIPFVVVGSSIWRILTFTFHVPLVDPAPAGADVNGDLPAWIPLGLYVVLLSILSELLAFTAIGLVARWGEVFPRWLPGLRGRRVPISLAVIPAVLGSLILTPLWAWTTFTSFFHKTIQWTDISPENPFAEFDWQFLVASVAYAPLVLWGPLLAAVTIAYVRRRTGRYAT